MNVRQLFPVFKKQKIDKLFIGLTSAHGCAFDHTTEYIQPFFINLFTKIRRQLGVEFATSFRK